MRFTTYRYRLDPTPEQATQFARWAGCCRWVYNACLAHREEVYRATGKGPGLSDFSRKLTAWRAEYDWLRAAPVTALQGSYRNLLAGYRRFFKGPNRRPKFKRKGRCRDSFRFPQITNSKWPAWRLLRLEPLSRRWARLKVPKMGWVRLRHHRPIAGEIRNVTISRDGKHWYASVLCGEPGDWPEAPEGITPDKTVGIDLGVVQSITTSDGEVIQTPTMSPGDVRRLKRLQRRLSRRKGPRKGVAPSKNWLKAKAALQSFHARWRRRRLDAIHKATTGLIRENQAISMEDLKTPQMTRRMKGKGRAAKAGLNQAILAQSWGEVRRQFAYKAKRAGVRFVLVDPAYTSQKCSACGHIERGNRRAQAEFACLQCGYTDNADINAAMNIKAAGVAASACEGDVRPEEIAAPPLPAQATPMKQEPLIGRQVYLF